MATLIQADPAPIHEDDSGALRVGGTRVLLELVVNAFEDGATPETIVQRYESLSLSDAYAVISYYLRHRDVIVQYLRRREQEATAVRQRIDAAQRDLSDIRRRLLAHRSTTEQDNAPVGE